jgi:hypothetical protein
MDAFWNVISIMGSIPHGSYPISTDQKKRAREWLLHKLVLWRVYPVEPNNDITKKQYQEKQDRLLGRLMSF